MRTIFRRRITLLMGVLSVALLANAQVGPQSGEIPDIPEPTTWTLGLIGLGGLAAFKFWRCRKDNKS